MVVVHLRPLRSSYDTFPPLHLSDDGEACSPGYVFTSRVSLSTDKPLEPHINSKLFRPTDENGSTMKLLTLYRFRKDD